MNRSRVWQWQGGDAGGWDGNDEGGANNDDGAGVGDEDDFDNLEDMIRALRPEILLNSPKGLENLERVTKASKKIVYGVEKGCPIHWTLLRFVLELLILKAKYGWSDCSFNDLLRLLSWAATTKLSSRQHIPSVEGHKSIDNGGWKNPCMPQPLYTFSWWNVQVTR